MTHSPGVPRSWARVPGKVGRWLLFTTIPADHGWKLLPYYRFDVATGQWRHRSPRPQPVLRLQDNSYRDGVLRYRSRHVTEPEFVLPGYIEDAHRVVADAVAAYRPDTIDDAPLPEPAERLRWFSLSAEVLAELTAGVDRSGDLPVHLAPEAQKVGRRRPILGRGAGPPQRPP